MEETKQEEPPRQVAPATMPVSIGGGGAADDDSDEDLQGWNK